MEFLDKEQDCEEHVPKSVITFIVKSLLSPRPATVVKNNVTNH